MINVFVGLLAFHALFGFAFEDYLFSPWITKAEYGFAFNGIFAIIVLVIIGIYTHMLLNRKKQLSAFNKALKDNLKYSIIINVIGVLLAQAFFVQLYRTYQQLAPQETEEVEEVEEKSSKRFRRRG